MQKEFVNNLYIPEDNFHVQNPHYFIRIDSIDNASIIRGDFKEWTANQALENPQGNWIGLKRSDAATSVTFTKTFTMPKAGKYILELFLWKRPQVSNGATAVITVAGATIHTESMYNQWADYGTWVRTPIFTAAAGSNTVTLALPKQSFAAEYRLVPITRYEGGLDYTGPSETRLDLMSFDFTTNGVNEVDKATIKIGFKEDYYTDDNPYSTLCFDAYDHITIWLGPDKRTAIPMFGGYISGWSLDDEMKVLTLEADDRIIDLGRTFVWKNFSIGYIPESTTGQMPFTQFPNVNEIARYLCTSDFGINFDAITKDYIFYNNFAEASSITGLTAVGWNLDWQPEFGRPAPCMRIRPGPLNNEHSLTIYSSTQGEWNAAEYNFFNFDYYASGAGVKMPVRFNIEIDMYKYGEEPSAALTYTVLFNGPSQTTRVIGNALPSMDGIWHSCLLNLKALFDAKAPSQQYLIKAIRFVGEPDSSVMVNSKCSSIYIDHIMAYREFQSAPRYASNDSKTALHELQDLCTKCNQIAFVRPGAERRQDQLIMIPKRFYTLPYTIEEGKDLIDVTGLQYKPLDWGLSNNAWDTFNYDSSRSGSVTAKDEDSIKWYNYIGTHEFLSDVNNDTDALTLAKYNVNEHSFWYPAFEVKLRGSILFEPGQYVNVRIPSRRLRGAQEVQSIKYDIDCVNGLFTTSLSFNKPHKAFRTYLRQSMKALAEAKALNTSGAFRSFGNQEGALNTSTGTVART